MHRITKKNRDRLIIRDLMWGIHAASDDPGLMDEMTDAIIEVNVEAPRGNLVHFVRLV